jgi:hypothetical protein
MRRELSNHFSGSASKTTIDASRIGAFFSSSSRPATLVTRSVMTICTSVIACRLPSSIGASLTSRPSCRIALSIHASGSVTRNRARPKLIKTHGPDSLIARTAATMYGSSETTFYVLAVYFGAVGIRRTRHAVPAALIADLVGDRRGGRLRVDVLSRSGARADARFRQRPLVPTCTTPFRNYIEQRAGPAVPHTRCTSRRCA